MGNMSLPAGRQHRNHIGLRSFRKNHAHPYFIGFFMQIRFAFSGRYDINIGSFFMGPNGISVVFK